MVRSVRGALRRGSPSRCFRPAGCASSCVWPRCASPALWWCMSARSSLSSEKGATVWRSARLSLCSSKRRRARSRAQNTVCGVARPAFPCGTQEHLELLDAQRQLYAARQAPLDLRRSAFGNAVALYKALGGGLMGADANPCLRAPRGASGWQPARCSFGADSHVLSQPSG